MIYKRINDIKTVGTDEYGNDITTVFDTIDLLQRLKY